MEIRDGIVIKYELNLILLLDSSYSMIGGRITQLNNAIPKLKKSLIKIADDKDVDLKVRIISFNDNIDWKVGSREKGEDASSIVWQDLSAEGGTSTSKVIREANKSLEYLGAHALRPVVILVTDGGCIDRHEDYLDAIEAMKKKLVGNTGKEKVIRIAVGVDGYNKSELVEFASEGLLKDVKQPLVFEIDNATDLGKAINWVTVSSMYSSIANDDEDIIDLGDPDWDTDLGKVINWVPVSSMYSSITNDDEDIIDLEEPDWEDDDDDIL